MALKMISSDKFKTPFMKSLPPIYKALWEIIYLMANHAGIWIVDWEILMLYLDRTGATQIDMAEALEVFNKLETTVEVSDDGASWFLVPYVKEQQSGKLNPANKVHQSIIKILSNTKFFKHVKPLISPFEGAIKIGKEDVIAVDQLNEKEQAEKSNCATPGPIVEYNLKPDSEQSTAEDLFELYQLWTDQVLNHNDPVFEQMLMREKMEYNAEAVKHFLSLLAQYPNKRPASQQRFRTALMEEIKKYIKPKPANSFHKEEKPAGPYIAPKPYQAPLTKAIHINGDGLKASISLDIEKLFKNPDFKPNAGAIKLEYLRKQGVVELSESQIKDYKSDAKGIRISELNLDYGNLDNKKLLRDHESGNLTETEKGIINTMSKSLAYESWLSNEIEKLKEVAEI